MTIDYTKLDRDNLEFLLDLTNSLFSTLNSSDLLHFLSIEVATVTGATRCSIIKVLNDDKALVMASHETKVPKGLTIDLKKYPEVVEALEKNTLVAIEDISHDPLMDEAKQYLQDAKDKSILIVPMAYKDNTAGTILLRVRKATNFTENEINLSYLIAKASYKAIKNAITHENLKASEANCKEMSVHDSMTWLYNRGYFTARLDEEFERAVRYSVDLTLLMVDIDDFEKINDKYGHAKGNLILTEIAVKLKNMVRKSDFVARFGSGTFAIILSHTNLEGAKVEAERLRASIENSDFGDLMKDRVTVSIGISEHNISDAKTSESLTNKAKNALFKAKDEGKNRVVASD